MICELRNYTTQPGRRDELIALFEREFVDSQETMGSRIVGTFRNVDDPDRFVWIRAFADMPARAAALDAFYTSAGWLERRAVANATIADSDDVLLLRPVAGRLIELAPVRAPAGASGPFDSRIVVDTWFLEPRTEVAFAALFADAALPLLRAAGAAPLATFATLHAVNSYPRLPVRENETVFVALTRFESAAAQEAHRVTLPESADWRRVAAEIERHLIAPASTLRLEPTARSALH
jgi:quinol monooxygenase YgiN